MASAYSIPLGLTLSKFFSGDFDIYSRENKILSVLLLPLLVMPVSLFLSFLYYINQEYLSATVVLFYTFASFLNLLHYRYTGNLFLLQKTQMILILFLPFFVMWSLGGFGQSSYIILWAIFAPVGALIHHERERPALWIGLFFLLLAFSLIINPYLEAQHQHRLNYFVQNTLLFLNISATMSGLFLLLKLFISQKEHEQLRALQEKNKELKKLLFIDRLTGIANRNALTQALLEDQDFSLILLNIDSFSEINNLYGETFGDTVLQKFAQMLQERIIKKQLNCRLFHLGGDEFVILSHHIQEETIRQNIEHLMHFLDHNPLVIDKEHIVSLNITAGISFQRENRQLLATANMALKLARRKNKRLLFYKENLSLNQEYKNNLYWIKEIKEAISENRIRLFFQPIYDNKKESVQKYETLIRLQKKDGTIVTPFYFLEIAKKAKLYKYLTKIVISESFKHFKKRDEEFSLNLTIDDILDKEIRNFLLQTLQKNRAVNKRVIFEIVESESIEKFEAVAAFINEVKEYGCRIAIDDFGSGYSNFEHLMRLQADFIKIDGSIIKEILHDKRSELITSVIVDFAHKSGIATIAEYVEDEALFEKICSLGIDYSQGYFIAKPQADLP